MTTNFYLFLFNKVGSMELSVCDRGHHLSSHNSSSSSNSSSSNNVGYAGNSAPLDCQCLVDNHSTGLYNLQNIMVPVAM